MKEYKRTITVVVLALAGVSSLGAAVTGAEAQAAPIRECGDVGGPGYGVYNITTRIVACRRARSMARAQYRGWVRLPHGVRWWGSFRCTVTHMGVETDDVRCVRSYDGGVVHWQIGA